MRKLALSDEILLKVDKAARYIGGEVNSVMKDLTQIDIRVAFCFPDVWEMYFIYVSNNNILYCFMIYSAIFWCFLVIFGIKQQEILQWQNAIFDHFRRRFLRRFWVTFYYELPPSLRYCNAHRQKICQFHNFQSFPRNIKTRCVLLCFHPEVNCCLRSLQALFLMENWMKEDKIMKCKMFDNANATKSTAMSVVIIDIRKWIQ